MGFILSQDRKTRIISQLVWTDPNHDRSEWIHANSRSIAAKMRGGLAAESEMLRETSRSDSFDGFSTVPDDEEDEWGYGPIGGATEFPGESAHDPQDSESASIPFNLTSWKADLGSAHTAQLDQTNGRGPRPFSSE